MPRYITCEHLLLDYKLWGNLTVSKGIDHKARAEITAAAVNFSLSLSPLISVKSSLCLSMGLLAITNLPLLCAILVCADEAHAICKQKRTTHMSVVSGPPVSCLLWAHGYSAENPLRCRPRLSCADMCMHVLGTCNQEHLGRTKCTNLDTPYLSSLFAHLVLT